MHADIQTIGYRPDCRHMVTLYTCGHVLRRAMQCGKAVTLTHATHKYLYAKKIMISFLSVEVLISFQILRDGLDFYTESWELCKTGPYLRFCYRQAKISAHFFMCSGCLCKGQSANMFASFFADISMLYSLHAMQPRQPQCPFLTLAILY